MKTKFLSSVSIALFAFASISCSTSGSDPQLVVIPPVTVGNTGDLRLFVIDTAKVNTITMAGTNETTILNRKVNSNSYISSLSLNNNASKFAYVDNQGGIVNGLYVQSKSVRVANANGSGDIAIYTAPANTNTVSNDIGFVKYGTSKIYFSTTTQTFVGGAISNLTKINVTNLDGTGLEALNGVSDGDDISADGRYLIKMNTNISSNRSVLIYDKTGDNGAGTLYNQESIPATASNSIAKPFFSYDDKFVYYAYVENQSLKIRIFNMNAKIWETKTIATNFSPTTFAMSVAVGSDNNRGILTFQTFDNARSKSYIFNLSAGSSTNFNNNDENVFMLKVW